MKLCEGSSLYIFALELHPLKFSLLTRESVPGPNLDFKFFAHHPAFSFSSFSFYKWGKILPSKTKRFVSFLQTLFM